MKTSTEIEVLLEDLDENDIGSILSKWREIHIIKQELDKLDEMLKTKVKAHLKERKWDRYNDENTNISVNITVQKRENINKELVKDFLTEAQYSQVASTTTFEKMSIVTPEAKERLKNYAKNAPKKRV